MVIICFDKWMYAEGFKEAVIKEFLLILMGKGRLGCIFSGNGESKRPHQAPLLRLSVRSNLAKRVSSCT